MPTHVGLILRLQRLTRRCTPTTYQAPTHYPSWLYSLPPVSPQHRMEQRVYGATALARAELLGLQAPPKFMSSLLRKSES